MIRMKTRVFALVMVLCMALTMLSGTAWAASSGIEMGSDTYQVKISGTNDYDSAYAILDSLNSYRQQKGLSKLTMDKDLFDTAMQRAAELAVYYSHTRPDGTSCFTAVPDQFFYGTLRENIAVGYRTAGDVMAAWKDSSGHNENMLAANNSCVGIGAFVDSDGVCYWVQVFSSLQGTAETAKSTGKKTVTADVVAAAEALVVRVTPGSAALHEGETAAVTVRNTNQGFPYASPEIIFTHASSLNENVAKVSVGANGKAVVTPVGSGVTTVKLGFASAKGKVPLTTDFPVTVTFQETGGGETGDGGDSGWKNPFVDVHKSDWFYNEIAYVAQNGLMNGTTKTTFSPYSSTTRAMIVTILYRLEGSPKTGSSGFDDVEDGKWYTDAVAWGSDNGIVEGYGNGNFGPNNPITREQMAAILYRYARYKGYDVSKLANLSGFADAGTVSGWALTAIRWANAEGLINGRTNTTLVPRGTATRAEVAVILMRFCQNVAGLE